MKIKNILLTSLLATAGAAFVSSASAAPVPVVYISGATTYRGSVTEAILDQSSTSVLAAGTTTCAFDNSGGATVFGSNAAIFHGFLRVGGQEVYIKTYWTGSAAGVYDVATQNSINGYIATPATVGGNIPGTSTPLGAVTGSNPAVATTGIAAGYTLDSHAPDAILSDSLANSVANEFSTDGFDATLTPAVTGAGLLACGNSSRNAGSTAASKGTVGIAPMLWVLGVSTVPANFTNITQEAAKSLFTGPTSAELLSGATSDKSNWVVLIGRNEDSGTRIGALAETQNTVLGGVQQYLPTFSSNQKTQGASPGFPSQGNPSLPEGGTGATVTGLGLWPTDWCLNTDNNIDWSAAGHSGFTGGGDVAKALGATNPVTTTSSSFFSASAVAGDVGNAFGDTNLSGQPTGFASGQKVWLVGYIGVADAIGGGNITGQTLSTSPASGVPGGTVLSYNGVKYTSIADVEHGSYTYWVLEHMYYNPNNTDTPSNPASATAQKNTVDDLADALFLTYAPTNSSGQTDATGLTHPNVAGILYSSMDFTKSSEGSVPSTK